MSSRLANPLRSSWTKVSQGASVARLKPFDTSTPEGRSKERYRRAALTSAASVAARGVGIVTSLVSVPLTVGYLGTERYGLWVTISSLAAILMFADLGMGNGLLNAVSEANGRDDREVARRYVSNAFFMLSGVAVALAGLFAVVCWWVPWSLLFNVESARAIAEAGPSVAIFVGCFLLSVPLSVARQAQMGYQEGFAANVWIALGSLLGLCGVLLTIFMEAGLPWLVLAMAGAPALAMLLNCAVLFGYQRPWLRPRFRDVEKSTAVRITQLGGLFLVLQLASAVAYESDSIVVAQIFGADVVTQYAIPWKLFMLVPLVLGIVMMPLWPAYGEAIVRGDVAWVKTTVFRSFAISLLITVPAAVLLVVFGKQVIHLWVGPEITPPFLLLLGMGLWVIVHGLSVPLAMLFNGANIVKFQVVCASLMAVANLALSVFLAYLIGLPGVIFGTLIAQLLFILIPYALYIPRLLSYISARTASADTIEATTIRTFADTDDPKRNEYDQY